MTAWLIALTLPDHEYESALRTAVDVELAKPELTTPDRRALRALHELAQHAPKAVLVNGSYVAMELEGDFDPAGVGGCAFHMTSTIGPPVPPPPPAP